MSGLILNASTGQTTPPAPEYIIIFALCLIWTVMWVPFAIEVGMAEPFKWYKHMNNVLPSYIAAAVNALLGCLGLLLGYVVICGLAWAVA